MPLIPRAAHRAGHKSALILLLILICVRGFGVDNEDDGVKPSYSDVMLKNALVPGLGFKMLGNEEEAYLYYAALPLNIVGAGLVTAAMLSGGNFIVLDMDNRDGLTSLFQYKNELTPASNLMLAGGVGLSLYGNLLAAYSSYAVHSDYVLKYGGGEIEPTEERISLLDAITAPFTPSHVVSIDVLPIIALATLGSFSVDDYRAMGNYFERDQVDFLGFQVTPLTGLGFEILLAGCLVTANAAWEELAYRGLNLQTSGFVHSSLTFGFAHLTNMLAPGVTVEGTLMQTLFATAFGFYAADRVLRGENGLEKMIALHFWNNVLSMVMSFLADPESNSTLVIRARL